MTTRGLQLVPTAAAIAAAAAQLLTVVGPVELRPGLGRLDVAGCILVVLLVLMHGVANFWQDQETRVMGSATKTGKVAFVGAVMRTALVGLCCEKGAIRAAGPYWDIVLLSTTLYELIAHWELREYTTPRFFKHLATHHLAMVASVAAFKILEHLANAGPIPETIVWLLWMYEGASGASDAWYVLCHTPLGVKVSAKWQLGSSAAASACFWVQRVLRIIVLLRGVPIWVTGEMDIYTAIYGAAITYGFSALITAGAFGFEAYCIYAQLGVMRTKTGVPFA